MQSSLRYFLYVVLLLKCCVDTEVHACGLNFCSRTRSIASTIKAFTSSSVLHARDRILSLSSSSSSSQEHMDRRLEPDDWLSKIFEDEIYQPHPIYYESNLADEVKYEDAVHIITSPSDKLKKPLIDFDRVAQVDRIEKDFFEGEVVVDLRMSRLFAIVRGKGGGKTRALEELQAEILSRKQSEILPVSITFNSVWPASRKDTMYTQGLSFIGSELDMVDINMAFAVVSRIASMFFALPLSQIRYELLRNVDVLECNLPCEDFTMALLHGIRKLMFKKLELKGRKVSKFVLMIDESVALQICSQS
jgi:hypothetical protein